MKKGYLYGKCPDCGKHGTSKSTFENGWRTDIYVECKYCGYHRVLDGCLTELIKKELNGSKNCPV
jgi:Zn ribbon nucleic-acid-binding protein